jgi:prevent-host-death family protein
MEIPIFTPSKLRNVGCMHMKVVSFTEFRNNASEVLNFVEKGATIRVTRHGKIIARIVPEGSKTASLAWKRKGLRPAAKGASLSKAILDERRGLPLNVFFDSSFISGTYAEGIVSGSRRTAGARVWRNRSPGGSMWIAGIPVYATGSPVPADWRALVRALCAGRHLL